MRYWTVFSLVIFSLISISCTQQNKADKASGGSQVVNLAIWTNFVTPEMLDEFAKKTGITVQVSNYSSNEELLAKIQAGADGYDVAVPSDYMVNAMKNLELLQRLD